MDEKLDWGQADGDRLRFAIEQYSGRLREEETYYSNLENKSKWVLGVTLPLSVAVVSYTYSISREPGYSIFLGMAILGLMITMAAWCAATALLPRKYKGSAIIPTESIDQWAEMICGSKSGLIRFHRSRIEHLADAISTNEASNAKKSEWLRRALNLATTWAVPAATLTFVVSLAIEWCLGRA